MANEDGRRAVEIYDSVQVHLSWIRLQLSKEAGVSIILHVHHTSHLTQGEDALHFQVFKTAFDRRKAEAITEMRWVRACHDHDNNNHRC